MAPSVPCEQLPAGECHVWVVGVDEVLGGGDERYRTWLTAEELERVRRYRFERHRRECTAHATAAIRPAAPGVQGRLSVTLWTLKEAYLKARGVGMALPTNRFTVALEGEAGARIHFDPVVRDDPAR